MVPCPSTMQLVHRKTSGLFFFIKKYIYIEKGKYNFSSNKFLNTPDEESTFQIITLFDAVESPAIFN